MLMSAAFPLAVFAEDDVPPGVPADIGDDPEYFKYYPPMKMRMSLLTADPSGSPSGFTTSSPFIESTYTHNDRFKYHKIYHGVDVSRYQEDVDWEAFKDAGVEFAIIRVAYRGYGSSGSLNEDLRYKENIPAAYAAGLPIGVYIYSQAITEAEARQEASYILERIEPYKSYITLPVIFDFEYASVGNGLGGRLYNANLTKEAATNICLAFCDEIEKNGYTAMVYANRNMLNDSLNASQISDSYDIWLAHYNTVTDYQGEYSFWQYTSSGQLAGKTNIDCNFWYVPVPAKDFSIEDESVSMMLSEKHTLTYTVSPTDTSERPTFKSSDDSVAVVDNNGVITAVGGGQAAITATAGNFSDSCKVTVYTPASGIEADLKELQIINGQSKVFTAKVVPDFAYNKNIIYSSSDESVAAVDQSGKVTAVSTGTCTITAKSEDGGFEVTCNVKTGPALESVAISASEHTMKKGSTYQLTAAISPSDADFKVIWSSSDSNIATVDSTGKVKAIAKGNCTITASCADLTATCGITVEPSDIKLSFPIHSSGNPSGGIKTTLTLTPLDGGQQSVSKFAYSKPASVTVEEGSYRLIVERSGHLPYIDNSFAVGSDTIDSVTLYAGDINGDGVINAKDHASMNKAFAAKTGDSNFNANADFNDDGFINAKDRSILCSNFGKTKTEKE